MSILPGKPKTLIAVLGAAVLAVGAAGGVILTRVFSRTGADAPAPVAQQTTAPVGRRHVGARHSAGRRAPGPYASMASAPPPPPPPAAVCTECGVIESIEPYTVPGRATGGGAVVGGLLGAVLGHQIGAGRGKDVATVAGAVGGAFAGNAIEKNTHKITRYRVGVRMEDGTREVLTLSAPPAAGIGERVRVVNGEVTRD